MRPWLKLIPPIGALGLTAALVWLAAHGPLYV
jgi:hypothetical protein